MIQNLKKEMENFLKVFLFSKPLNCVIICLVSIISYGGLVYTKTINNDYCFFIYSDPLSLIQQNRWGRSLLALLGFLDRDVPVWSDCLGIVFFVISALFFAFLWYKVSKGCFSSTAYLIFISLYLSYPLTFELTVYPTFMLEMGLCYSIIGFSFALMFCFDHKSSWKEILTVSFLNSIVFACYESFVFVYILLGLLIAFLVNKLEYDKNLIRIKDLFIVFVCSIISRSIGIFLVNISQLKTLSKDLGNNGPATVITWFDHSCSIGVRIIRLAIDLCYRYAYIGLIYFAIFMFIVCFLIMFYYSFFSKKKKKMLTLLLGIVITLFGLSFLQGYSQPYRTCQSFPIFVGFSGMLLYFCTKNKKTVFILIVFAVLMQMKELCIWQNYDIEQSNKLMHNICLVERELKQIPAIEQKEIIVLGEIKNEFDIRRSMAFPCFYKLPLASNKLISTHAGMSHFGDNIQFRLTFEYYTHLTIKELPQNEKLQIMQVIIKNKTPCFPCDGYIFQEGNRVVVNLGVTSLQEEKRINRRELIKKKIQKLWR